MTESVLSDLTALPLFETKVSVSTEAALEEHCAALEYRGVKGLPARSLFFTDDQEGICSLAFPQAEEVRQWLLDQRRASKDRCEDKLDALGFK